MWKTWGEAYMKVLKLYDSDLDDHAKDLLGEIYGLSAPIMEKKTYNE